MVVTLLGLAWLEENLPRATRITNYKVMVYYMKILEIPELYWYIG